MQQTVVLQVTHEQQHRNNLDSKLHGDNSWWWIGIIVYWPIQTRKQNTIHDSFQELPKNMIIGAGVRQHVIYKKC